jgi:exonuclease SbcC
VQELARRYRLQRIRDSLALMVLNQDISDEMRSVHSLSGGESFLVSLALALGLASLSSNRVRVESLFIDEGFGSLDVDTLRVAMDALDGLQAMDRKVGVISHVQEMTERIGGEDTGAEDERGEESVADCGGVKSKIVVCPVLLLLLPNIFDCLL